MSLLNELLNSAQASLNSNDIISALFQRLESHLNASEYGQKDIDNAIYTLIGSLEDPDVKMPSDYEELTNSLHYIHVMNFLCTLEGKYQPSDRALGALFEAILSEHKALSWWQFISPFVFQFYSRNYANFVLKYFVNAFPLQCFMSFCQKAAIYHHIEIVEEFCSFTSEQFVKEYKKWILKNVSVSKDMFNMLMNNNNATHVLDSADIDDVLLNIINRNQLPFFFIETISFLCELQGKNKPSDKVLLGVMSWALRLIPCLEEDRKVELTNLVSTIKEKVGNGETLIKQVEVVLKNAKKTESRQGSENRLEIKKLVKKECVQSENDADPYGNIIQRLKTYQKTEKQYPKCANWRLFKPYYAAKIRHRATNQAIATELLSNLSKADVEKKDLSKKEIIQSIKIIEKGHTIRSDKLNSIFKDAKKAYRRVHHEESFLERLFPCIK